MHVHENLCITYHLQKSSKAFQSSFSYLLQFFIFYFSSVHTTHICMNLQLELRTEFNWIQVMTARVRCGKLHGLMLDHCNSYYCFLFLTFFLITHFFLRRRVQCFQLAQCESISHGIFTSLGRCGIRDNFWTWKMLYLFALLWITFIRRAVNSLLFMRLTTPNGNNIS